MMLFRTAACCEVSSSLTICKMEVLARSSCWRHSLPGEGRQERGRITSAEDKFTLYKSKLPIQKPCFQVPPPQLLFPVVQKLRRRVLGTTCPGLHLGGGGGGGGYWPPLGNFNPSKLNTHAPQNVFRRTFAPLGDFPK